MIRLEEKDIDRAAMTLARSFWNDLFFIYLSPDEAQRTEALCSFFKFMLRYVILYGEAYATSADFEGAALWLPSKYARITPELAAKVDNEEIKRYAGEEFLARLNLVNDYVDAKHAAHISTAHWYLAYIGIDPDFKGKGFASKLLKPMLEKFSANGIPCYLETNTPGNVPLYEHYGFKVIEDYSVAQAGLAFYAMLKN